MPSRLWELAPHVCRLCLGRVLVCGGAYRCASCGVEASKPEGICGCGIKTPGRAGNHYKCGPNPDKTGKVVGEFVILFEGRPAQPQK